MTKKPETKFRAGQVSATVWKNEKKEGQNFDTFSVNIVKSYKTEQEDWKETTSFQLNELPKVALVSQKAYEYIALREEKGEASASSPSFTKNSEPNKSPTIDFEGKSGAKYSEKIIPLKSGSIVPKTDDEKLYREHLHKKHLLAEKLSLGMINEEQYHSAIQSEKDSFTNSL